MPVAASAVEVALKRIMVAIDFSPCSTKALRHSLARARNYDATLYLVHAVSSLGYTLAGEEAAVTAKEVADRDMEQLEEALEKSGALYGIPHHAMVIRGELCPEIERLVEQEQIDLLVMGTRSRTGIGRLLLGSVAESVFRHATCPVLTVGPSVPNRMLEYAQTQLHSVLFATDFGPASLHALSYAVSLAHRNRARMTLLHVLPPVPVSHPGPLWFEKPDLEHMRRSTEAAFMERLRSLMAQCGEREIKVKYSIEFDDPADGVLKTAALCSADLIVMGVKSASSVSAHLPWAIAQQIVGCAECPVMTVRV
jgi:nucleotide-binding universal stress UspA family protein